MFFTIDDIRKHFEAATIQRGQEFVRNGKVSEISLVGDNIKATVIGENNRDFHQDILLYQTRNGINFDGSCDCAVKHNCRHVVAALIAFLAQDEVSEEAHELPDDLGRLSDDVADWMRRVERVIHTARESTETAAKDAALGATSTYRLLFALSPDRSNRYVVLSVCKGRMRPNGDVTMASPVSEISSLLTSTPSYISSEELDLVRLFIAMRSGIPSQMSSAAEPRGAIGAQLLGMLLDENRLFWTNSYADMAKGLVFPLKPAPTREACLVWNDEGKALKLGWQLNPPMDGHNIGDYVLSTNPPWYIDNLSCGQLVLTDELAMIPLRELQELVAQAPPLKADNKVGVSHLLLAQGFSHIVPMPEPVREIVREDIPVIPCLQLGSVSQQMRNGDRWFDYAVLAFEYDGEKVLSGQTAPIMRESQEGIERIVRQTEKELAANELLVDYGFALPKRVTSPLRAISGAFELPSQSDWIRFTRDILPTLEAQGWRIEKLPEYRYELTEVDDWYAHIEHSANDPGKNWFEFELGIVVNQKPISLLPVLVDLIQNTPNAFNAKALAEYAEEDQLLATLSDGVRVALHWGRIKSILNILGELYFTARLSGAGRLRLSRLDAARMAELESGLSIPWRGGEELLDIGRKLGEFGGIEQVVPPRGLQAELRDYQVEGLSWMQFLREYGFAGILADDMGLGKTIQTLAHILLEKEAGRLDKPALVIAPTSLMSNWLEEAARFAPALSVLLLQGKSRMPRFDQIMKHDLVLTTYALLPRDEEMLLAHEYHMVILDESQYIKNMRSKSAQAAGMLRTRHRLCLTGTPLENHLGELWSQFHFLMPSLLGNEKSFNAEFRNPIEKLGDEVRSNLLRRRIKPFLLRRTKDKVAKELPSKTEVVRTVELSSAQRDLYETVRLAMDNRVRKEIEKKGVARSQIVILEALLKLRQVCCDPRLVKSDVSRIKGAASSKLVELMEMLEELLAEKRNILVFSQFTSMLSLIEAELKALDIPYAILTGSTIDRASVIKSFQEGEVSVFLISLKAGGVGLNLTAADTVIHYDPWWNPATETQATDRAWRIGQDKPVFVYKLIANGTLEQKIQELQQKKADLAQAMLSAGEAQNVQITPEDLDVIFAPLET